MVYDGSLPMISRFGYDGVMDETEILTYSEIVERLKEPSSRSIERICKYYYQREFNTGFKCSFFPYPEPGVDIAAGHVVFDVDPDKLVTTGKARLELASQALPP